MGGMAEEEQQARKDRGGVLIIFKVGEKTLL